MECRVVEAQAEWEALCGALDSAQPLAMDTEFLRVKTYFPKLCLLQIFSDQGALCIDPLTLDLNIDLFRHLLLAEQQVKIFHAARQDFEVLYGVCGAVPRGVFDTQVAAAMLGLGDQIGYAPLVQSVTGKSLPKAHTRTDWCRRPLTPQQLKYAVDDVRYLVDLYRHLAAELEQRGRLRWVFEECEGLSDPSQYDTDPETAYKRLGAGRMLPPRSQAVLKALSVWREQTSQALDLPRNWVIKDSALIEVARMRPHTAAGLATVDGVTPKFVAKHGDRLLKLVREVERRDNHAVIWRRPVPLDESQRALYKRISALLKAVSTQESISIGLLGSRQDVDGLVRGRRDVGLLRGWRAELLGDQLKPLLD